jgi:hypothetical protein
MHVCLCVYMRAYAAIAFHGSAYCRTFDSSSCEVQTLVYAKQFQSNHVLFGLTHTHSLCCAAVVVLLQPVLVRCWGPVTPTPVLSHHILRTVPVHVPCMYGVRCLCNMLTQSFPPIDVTLTLTVWYI